jgi:EAL and modified HD-GYP domain-containing signal transduction protein
VDVFVARQPIFDRQRRLFAYELLFRSGLTNVFDAADGDRASLKVISDSFLRIGLPKITGGKRAFINFTRDTLVKGYATLLPRQLVVVEILEDVEHDPEVLEACRDLKRRGYTLALDDYVCEDWSHPLVPFADIIKVDFRQARAAARADLPQAVKGRKIRTLAEKIETRAEFDEALRLGYDFLQGYFFSRPMIVSGRDIPGFRLRYLEILREVSQAQFDLRRVEEIVKHEPSLAYKLMTYINAVAFGFRNRIRSIRQALVLLGEDAVRKWAAVVALAGLAEDQPGELIVTSLVRARFCELLAADTGLDDRAQELFFMGLFSLLDAITGRPMGEVVSDLPLADDVKLGLQGADNRLHDVLGCVLAHERAEWAALSLHAARLGLEERALARLHLDSMAWGTENIPPAARR